MLQKLNMIKLIKKQDENIQEVYQNENTDEMIENILLN